MGLIRLRLVAALEPSGAYQSMAIATTGNGSPIRGPAEPIPPDSNSTQNFSFKLPSKRLLTKTMPSDFLPYGDDQWRTFLGETKVLFQEGQFKKCSDRCVEALKRVRGPVS